MFTQNDLELMVQQWFRDGGDNRFRYSYDLSQNSVVFDVGAYIGNWAKKIYDIYHCRIYAFEPVKEFYTIASSYLKYREIQWYNFGLGDKNQEMEIGLNADGSSVFIDNVQKEQIRIKSFSSVLKFLNIPSIDLLKINIEGGEYDLLNHILNMNLQTLIKNIQVQFHINVQGCEIRRDSIRERLSNSHAVTFDYPFVWENWRMK
jgi:FkbM family methyltransferase